MTKTTLQVPIDQKLKMEADKKARELGFSSLQELIRLFLSKLVLGVIDVGFYDKSIDEIAKIVNKERLRISVKEELAKRNAVRPN